MKITGTRSNIFIEYEGKTLIKDVEMVINGFYAEPPQCVGNHHLNLSLLAMSLKTKLLMM
jgi:hypothetical protein